MIKNIFLGVSVAGMLLLGTGSAYARPAEVTLNSLSVKLDQVIKTQQDIMQKLEELQTEINVVKIRASRV